MTRATTLQIALTVAALLVQPAPTTELRANDASALNVVFGDEYLADNVLDVCSHAASLPLEDRYEYLANQVLPSDRHATLRTVADFSPTHPPPSSGESQTAGFRIPSGGQIMSPVLDLIDAASALRRLEELRRRADATTTNSLKSQVDRLAMLALIDIARNDLPSAQTILVQFFALVLSDAAMFQADSPLLCLHAAAGDPSLSRAVVDAAYVILASYQRVEEWSAWQRQFSAAYARVKQTAGVEDDGRAIEGDAASSSRWHPASLPRARYRGAGCPIAQWRMERGQAENLSSHDEDFLYFSLPLRGDFEVEWDIPAFGWRTSELFVAGQWIVAQHDYESYKEGDLRGTEARNPITPPLTRVRDVIHYRAVVRDGISTTYINGRRVHEQSLTEESDPWLAIRSVARQDGAVRDLRLSGDPVVVDEIRLSGATDLDGWMPYFEELNGVDWRYRAGGDRMGELYARRQSDLPRGCHQESALFYHRPMLEDGSIAYEFWYEAGLCEAHPVLDRLCFLLLPEGVKVHWLTDGPFDRTSMPPDNLLNEPDNRRGPATSPIHDGWNQLQLTVRGHAVNLLLNGELVYQRLIEPTNQRHFGLFHFADQAELRVRNVIWTGDWPREIPGIEAQQLAVDETGFLDDRLPELTSLFSHDFAADGLPLDQFAVTSGQIPTHFVAARDGLRAMRQGTGGYQSTTIAPSLAVSGDFDITASFEQFVTDPRGAGSSNLYLIAIAGTGDESLLIRRHMLIRGEVQQIIQCSRVHLEGNEKRRLFLSHRPMEALAGTMRLARRGEKVYYLFAENDSRQFRLIGEEPFPDEDLRVHGVLLGAQISGDDGATSVVWKNLTVRAEELSGPAIDARAGLLPNLNQEQ